MNQLVFPGMPVSDKATNVSVVPHRSPFRYPGGKTWLVPKIRQWFQSLETPVSTLIEPFAGGGIIGLTAAFERLARHVILIELDEQVAAVWHTILSDDAEWLVSRIGDFDCTLPAVVTVLESTALSTRERAFQTIVKNRTHHGGILASSSSLLKNGENGKGVRSRWYPATLQRRIRDISAIRDRISFVQGDGLAIIEAYSDRPDVSYFIDPPYTAPGKMAGARLYDCFQLDHGRLFESARQIQGDFLMTYDDTVGVRNLASRYGFDVTTVSMQNTHLAKMKELLIAKKPWTDVDGLNDDLCLS